MTTALHGYCECGCGERTSISAQNHPRYGWVKGEPMRFIRGHNNRGRALKAERYRVEDRDYLTPCWIWQLEIADNGYGRSQHRPAHRIYWEQVHGPLAAGMVLDHLCRVRCCVNPGHLEPVTHDVNCHRGKGTKLTREDVIVIRARLAAGERGADLARAYDVSAPTISEIKNRRKWASV